MMRLLARLIACLLGLILALIAVMNRHAITLDFFPLPVAIDLPAYLLIGLCFVTGFFCAWLGGRWRILQLHRVVRQQQHKIQALQSESLSKVKAQAISNASLPLPLRADGRAD